MGILYYYTYYNEIGIAILPYLQVSEIVLSSLNNIPIILIVAMTSVALNELFYACEPFLDRQIEKVQNKFIKIFLHLLSYIPIAVLGLTPMFIILIKDNQLLINLSVIILFFILAFCYNSNFMKIKIDFICNTPQ